mmetsp:Transcript_27018/g.81401  ORF Transcript_27018/g.81401 Transcript_27018/m.81401 type:complete len:1250 (+) Transcript_27018:136-3885(+)
MAWVEDAGRSCSGSEASDEDAVGHGWTTVKARPRQSRRQGPQAGHCPEQRKASVQEAWPSSSRRTHAGPPGTCGGHLGQQDRHLLERKVFVQGLTLSTTDGLLRSAFRHCGRIEDAKVVRLADGTSRGFGFIVFSEVGAAAMAARDGGVRIDGKLCFARLARPREETGPDVRFDDANTADARSEVREFITRHELAGGARLALFKADPKTALRVVRAIESCNLGFSEGLILSELQKVTRTHVSREVEARVSEWVLRTGLSSQWRDRVESVLLAQRSEEIEHVLEVGRSRWFQGELCSKDNPTTWLLGQVQKFRRQQTLGDIHAFCQRFGFDQVTERQLSELSAERARRLMQGWRPAAPGTQKQRQQEFLVLLNQALKERRMYKEERERQRVSAVASHARIIEEWSEEDEEEAPPVRRHERDDNFYAFDLSDLEGQAERPAAARNRPGSSTEQFVIHSCTESVRASSAITAQSGSLARRRQYQPKPTHFVLCVDTSGSMVTADCQNANGWHTSRLEVVLETCNSFITSSVMNSEDIYSFVTFNEESVLHFSCLHAFDAVAALEALQPVAEKQTFYAMGIRGIEAAIRRDVRRLPAHVVFLSDGEPTDPSSYLQDLQVLRRRHPGEALKIYAVGFGESAKVSAREEDFAYLQQLASLGRGHFQRCGASLNSLQGAFTAVTSSISQTRSSAGRRSEAPAGSASAATEGSERQASAVAACSMPATIDEELAEELASQASAESEQGRAALAPKPPSAVEFELPHPAQIFRDVRSRELWRDFMAAQTSFRFDGHSFTRSAAVQRVFLRRKPFMQGGMRLVYGMLLENGVDSPDAVEHMMCAKRLFQDLEKDRGFQAHAAFCKSTAVAHYFARQFRAATEKVLTKVQFGFLDCQLYSPVGAGEDGYHFCGEAWLKGHFVKLNSNAGFVNEADYSEHSAIAQAFSHFTFDRSHGELLVVDLQGICGGEGDNPYFLLTDPQVHSRGAFERFGAGDLGEAGICAFFQKHKCGEFCQKLRLRKEYDLRAPTHVLRMPGVQDCIRHMLGKDGKDFFQQLRQNCRLSSITLPREAHSEWLDIRMWATKRGGVRAEQLLQQRLGDFYEKARVVLAVQPRPQWDLERWQAQLESWRRESGAAIVAYPPDWAEGQGVQELWVFSELLAGGRYGHQNRSFACQRIQEALERAQGEELLAGAGSSRAPQPESWRQYQDRNNSKYWYREPDGYWFWESDPQWQRFFDEASRCHWWWNTETGLWFYEPQR